MSIGFAQNLELHKAAFYGNIRALKLILKSGLQRVNSCNIDGNTALMMAMYGPFRKLKLPIMNVLIAHGADVDAVNKKGDTALHAAVMGVANARVPMECVERLIECGADIRICNLKGKTVAQVAFDEGEEKLLDFLLKCSEERIMCESSKSLWYN